MDYPTRANHYRRQQQRLAWELVALIAAMILVVVILIG